MFSWIIATFGKAVFIPFEVSLVLNIVRNLIIFQEDVRRTHQLPAW
jgi:hypothetical protein